jgi:hypothetical protein
MIGIGMPTEIPDLWPDEVTNVNATSPVAILRIQAGLLRGRTHSILEAVIETDTLEQFVDHKFIVIAPALNRYRHVLFSASHDPNQVYPVTVQAQCLEGHGQYGQWPTAESQDDFLKLISAIFKSGDTKAVIQSLIAQSNDIQSPKN